MGTKRGGETVSLRKDLAVVNACRQESPSRPACRSANGDYMHKQEWLSWVGIHKG